MSRAPNRKLTTQEMDLLLFLLRTGGGGHAPVKLLSGAQKRVLPLARMGLIHVWLRQSVTRSRTEGPFYTLTSRGRELAQSLYEQRRTRKRDDPATIPAHVQDQEHGL